MRSILRKTKKRSTSKKSKASIKKGAKQNKTHDTSYMPPNPYSIKRKPISNLPPGYLKSAFKKKPKPKINVRNLQAKDTMLMLFESRNKSDNKVEQRFDTSFGAGSFKKEHYSVQRSYIDPKNSIEPKHSRHFGVRDEKPDNERQARFMSHGVGTPKNRTANMKLPKLQNKEVLQHKIVIKNQFENFSVAPKSSPNARMKQIPNTFGRQNGKNDEIEGNHEFGETEKTGQIVPIFSFEEENRNVKTGDFPNKQNLPKIIKSNETPSKIDARKKSISNNKQGLNQNSYQNSIDGSMAKQGPHDPENQPQSKNRAISRDIHNQTPQFHAEEEETRSNDRTERKLLDSSERGNKSQINKPSKEKIKEADLKMPQKQEKDSFLENKNLAQRSTLKKSRESRDQTEDQEVSKIEETGDQEDRFILTGAKVNNRTNKEENLGEKINSGDDFQDILEKKNTKLAQKSVERLADHAKNEPTTNKNDLHNQPLNMEKLDRNPLAVYATSPRDRIKPKVTRQPSSSVVESLNHNPSSANKKDSQLVYYIGSRNKVGESSTDVKKDDISMRSESSRRNPDIHQVMFKRKQTNITPRQENKLNASLESSQSPEHPQGQSGNRVNNKNNLNHSQSYSISSNIKGELSQLLPQAIMEEQETSNPAIKKHFLPREQSVKTYNEDGDINNTHQSINTKSNNDRMILEVVSMRGLEYVPKSFEDRDSILREEPNVVKETNRHEQYESNYNNTRTNI